MAEQSQNQISGLDLVAKAVVVHREELLWLLRGMGWTLDDDITAKTLTGVTLEMLQKGSAQFRKELAGILTRESNFAGANPLSAVTGAIGSLSQLVQTAINRKQIKRQAQAATLTALLDARQIPVAVYRPSKPKPVPKPKRSALPLVVGGLLLMGIVTAAFIHFKSPST